MSDLKFAVRQLLKTPGFTAVVVVTLALAIGANTAVFSVINRVLLLPLPFKDPDHLVWVRSQDPKNNVMDNSSSGIDYLAWRRDNTVFEQLCALYTMGEFNLRGRSEPVALRGALATDNFFSTFGFRFSLGGGFAPEHGQPGSERVVVFSDSFWKRQFGGETNVLGTALMIDDTPHTVAGILAPGLSFLDEMIDAYVPITKEHLSDWQGHDLQVFGRLKPGVSLHQARAELSAISKRVDREWPQLGSSDATAFLLRERLVEAARPTFLILHVTVLMVLLIACANVANLLLARGQGRRRELAVRAALGGSRGRILRQLITESLLLSLTGAVLGVLLAFGGIELLPLLSPKFHGVSIPFFAEISLDRHVLVFTLVLAVAAGLGSGLVPAFLVSKLRLAESLQDSSRATMGPQRHWLLGSMVVCQVALSTVLLVGAVLLIRNFHQLSQADPGFEPRNLLSMRMRLSTARYPDETAQRLFYREVLDRVERLGQVKAAGLVNFLPMDVDNCANSFRIVGAPTLPDGRYQLAEWRIVSSHYFQAMRIPLKRGRGFDEHDQGQSPVVIVNEAFARQYLGDGDPLRHQLTTSGAREPCQIIGIVGNTRFFGLGNTNPPTLYLPMTQVCPSAMSMVVRSQTEPLGLAKPVQEAIWIVDPAQPVSKVRSLDELMANSISIQRFAAVLLAVFASVAVALSSIGLYGVLAYAVSQRTHEIGVRMALGARGPQILQMVQAKGWRLASFGLAIGFMGALAVSVPLQSVLFEMGARDPVTLLVAIPILALTVAAACHFPARRATRVDPLIALRHE